MILESNPEQSKVWKDEKNEINENGDDIGKDHVPSISGPQVTSINVTPSSPGIYSSYKLLARFQHNDAYMKLKMLNNILSISSHVRKSQGQ